jgi:hypothetical protein
MDAQPIGDADRSYLEEVAADIAPRLGPGVTLLTLVIDTGEPNEVLLRARYSLAGESIESVGRGENVAEAHARLRAAIVGDRIGLGLRVLV